MLMLQHLEASNSACATVTARCRLREACLHKTLASARVLCQHCKTSEVICRPTFDSSQDAEEQVRHFYDSVNQSNAQTIDPDNTSAFTNGGQGAPLLFEAVPLKAMLQVGLTSVARALPGSESK
jgi:hypothetical protein